MFLTQKMKKRVTLIHAHLNVSNEASIVSTVLDTDEESMRFDQHAVTIPLEDIPALVESLEVIKADGKASK